MNSASAELYLQCHRAGFPKSPVVEKAVRMLSGREDLKRKLEEQQAFDAQIAGAVSAIQPPDDLKQRISARSGRTCSPNSKGRPQFTVPIIIAMACGVLSIVGLLAVMEIDSLAHFPGRETAERMIDTANGMSGIELEPISSTAGQLGDWFLLHGFESYGVPEEMASIPALGLRTLRIDGKPVAQVVLDRGGAILYIFRASDFGFDIPQKAEWKSFSHEGWTGAIRRRDDTCTLVILRGSGSEMDSFLASLHRS